MKVVFDHTFSDGCTYNCERSFCVEYESADAFALLIIEKAEEARARGDGSFMFLNEWFTVEDFITKQGEWILPTVYELDDWFNANRVFIA